MPIHILMPALSPTMTEGTLARWLVDVGDHVRPGDVIAEIETNTATMEVEAVDAGVVGAILVPAGRARVKVHEPIALLLLEGERPAVQSPRTGRPEAAHEPERPAAGAPPVVQPFVPRGRILASPLARRLAQERRIDLARVRGSGPQGRILKRDVEAAGVAAADLAPRTLDLTPLSTATERAQLAPQLPAGAGSAPRSKSQVALRGPSAAPAPRAAGDDRLLSLYEPGSFEIVPHDGMRRAIAERVVQSKQTIPHFHLSGDCRLDTLVSVRERLNGASPRSGPRAYRLSINDILIKAMALALQQVPAANATWLDGGMLRHKSADVGVAVAVEGGHCTPVIRHAEVKTLAEISNEMKDLAERARTRRLAAHEVQGGATSISNLGMYGVRSFDPVINPPHASILAVGAGERRPAVAGDKIEIATVMELTLSCDHRVIDGATGAALLAAFKSYVEDPVRMLV